MLRFHGMQFLEQPKRPQCQPDQPHARSNSWWLRFLIRSSASFRCLLSGCCTGAAPDITAVQTPLAAHASVHTHGQYALEDLPPGSDRGAPGTPLVPGNEGRVQVDVSELDPPDLVGRRTARAHARDVCKTENQTRETTHGGARRDGALGGVS